MTKTEALETLQTMINAFEAYNKVLNSGKRSISFDKYAIFAYLQTLKHIKEALNER